MLAISVSRPTGPVGTPGFPRPLAPVLWGIRLLEGPQRRGRLSQVSGRGRTAPLTTRERVAPSSWVPSEHMGSGSFLAASPHLLQPGPRCPSDPGAQPPRPRSPGIYLCPLSDQPHQPGPCLVLVVRSRLPGPWGPTAHAPHAAHSCALSCGQRSQGWAVGHPRGALSVPLGVWGVPCAAGLWPLPETDQGSGRLSPWVTGARRGQGKAGTMSCPSPCFSAPTRGFWKITQGNGQDLQSQCSFLK